MLFFENMALRRGKKVLFEDASFIINPKDKVGDRVDIDRILSMPQDFGSDLIGANAIGGLIQQVRQKNIIQDEELDKMLEDNGFAYLLE